MLPSKDSDQPELYLKIQSFRAVNTHSISYKNQSVNAV